jgi:hypothetical protein
VIRLHVVGQCAIRLAGTVIRPGAERLFAAVLYLCGERGRYIDRDILAKLLWPDVPSDRRRHNMRQMIYKIRGLGIDRSVIDDDLMLRPQCLWTDWEDSSLDDLCLSAGALSPDLGSVTLPGYRPSFSPDLAAWLDELVSRIECGLRRRLAEGVQNSRDHGRWDTVEVLARCLLRLDPLNEEGTIALAEALSLAGSKSTAIALLQAYSAEVSPIIGDTTNAAIRLSERLGSDKFVYDSKPGTHTSLVGRDPVMSLLASAIMHLKDSGVGSLHFISGAAGVGKSRVLEEIAAIASLREIAVCRRPSRMSNPLGYAIAELITSLLEVRGALGLAPSSLQCITRFADSAKAGLVTADNVAPVLPAIVDLLLAITWEVPLLLVLDDWHTFDAISVSILSNLLPLVKTERVAIVGSAARGTVPPAGGRWHTYSLDPLGPDEAATFAARLYIANKLPVDNSACHRIGMATGGYPALIRDAVSIHIHNRSTPLAEVLDSIMTRRLAQLAPQARNLLLSIVAGANVTLRDLAALHGERVALDVVAALVGDGIVSVDASEVPVVQSYWRSVVTALYSPLGVAVKSAELAVVVQRKATFRTI